MQERQVVYIPQAHLWDNGSDAVSELKEVMKYGQKHYHSSEKKIFV
jgi:hypothetical protein